MNLPAADKMVDPYFTMLWDEDLPRHHVTDADGHRDRDHGDRGRRSAGLRPPPPPPDSWAARPEADVAIWHLVLEPGATLVLPTAASAETVRTLYVFEGSVRIDEQELEASTGAVLRVDAEVELTAGPGGAEALVSAGPPDRRAGRAVRPVRDERPGRHPAGVRRLPRDRVRRLALARRRSRARHETGRFARRPDGTEDRPA